MQLVPNNAVSLAVEKAKRLLFRRRNAYRMVFNRENVYTPTVLNDLAKFCRANETTFHNDPRVHALLEGRREVLLRILRHLNFTEDEIWEITTGRKNLDE